MSIDEQRTESSETVVMSREKKPLHVRIVSIGATILLIVILLIVLDLFGSMLAAWIAGAHAGLTEEAVPVFVLSVRFAAILSLVTAYWFGFLGEKIYAHRAGRILQKFLIAAVCLLVFFVFGVGLGLIITFAMFFWEPKITANWDKRSLNIYHSLFLGVVLFVMLLETRSLEYFGIFLSTNYFVSSLSSLLAPSGLAW